MLTLSVTLWVLEPARVVSHVGRRHAVGGPARGNGWADSLGREPVQPATSQALREGSSDEEEAGELPWGGKLGFNRRTRERLKKTINDESGVHQLAHVR